MKTLSGEEKIYITDETVERGYQRCLEGEDHIAQAATLERRGGPCPICGVPFNVVFVDNEYGCFQYYQPSCRCYKRCEWVKVPSGVVPGCGRWLIAEKLVGIDYCTSCHTKNPEEKPKQVRLPKRTNTPMSRKDLAAGERPEE